MKKGFVALLMTLAIIVLISPAIVGRLAEQSMDENLDWAATESEEVVVTSSGFDRGWFSSQGQHRVEIRAGELQNVLLALADSESPTDIPTLIIDTRLDHGLIPLASMTRDQGSLVPGLGSAISILSVEFADGETLQLPGTIYTNVGLTGELRSRFVLDSDSHEFEGASAVWGNTTIEVVTDPSTGTVSFDGAVTSLALAAEGDFVEFAGIGFSGKQRQSRFGFSVGDADIEMQSMAFENRDGESATIGPLSIDTTSRIDGERVTGRTLIKLDNTPFVDFGTAGIAADISLVAVDAAALGKITDALDDMQDGGSTDDFMFVVQDDLQRLMSRGFELRIDQLDVVFPQGRATTKFSAVVEESDADMFSWTSVLLALNANAEISLPAELVDMLTALDPQMHAAIAGGFLRKNGDVYEMQAAFKKGLLTVNGAPMPLPIPGLQ